MAALTRHPASTPLARCGNVTSPESDRGELAPETATTAIDAQPAVTSVAHTHETSQSQSLGTPHDQSPFSHPLTGSDPAHLSVTACPYPPPPLLTSPWRPTLAELIARHIFLTHTTQISRRLARNLVAIRLSRRLPQRPSAEALVQRGVLPPECVPGCGCGPIAPALVAKRRAVEKEKLKDGLRRWVGGVWRGEVKERSEGVRKWEERAGVGRVWRLRRFWERVGQSGI